MDIKKVAQFREIGTLPTTPYILRLRVFIHQSVRETRRLICGEKIIDRLIELCIFITSTLPNSQMRKKKKGDK